MTTETIEELDQYITTIKDKRVLVVGDAVVDKYIYGTTTRISPDAPVPVLDVTRKDYYVGALGLVVNFIRGFGGRVDLCTVTGNDFEGQYFAEEVRKRGVEELEVISEANFTPQVTRVKARSQHLLRMEKTYELSRAPRTRVNERILQFVETSLPRADVLLLLDFNAGLFSENYLLVNNLVDLARHQAKKVVTRPDRENYHLFGGVDLARVNVNEAAAIVGINARVNETSIRIIANKLANELQCGCLYLSYLDGESYFFADEELHIVQSMLGRRGTSYVGAGSAMMAMLALLTASGAPAQVMVEAANAAGAISAVKPPVTFFEAQEVVEVVKRGTPVS